MKALAMATVLSLVSVLALSGALARAADPPVVSVGSDGRTDTCLNDQHSDVNPSAVNAGGVLQLSNGSCSSSTAPAAAPQADQSRAAAQTSGGAGAGTASAGSAQSGATVAVAVTAANAVGLRIASIRVHTRKVGKTRRVSVLVTVRDLHKRLVRYAFISLACPKAARALAGCNRSSFSNSHGQAAFGIRVGTQFKARRIAIAVTARTPKVRARKGFTVRLPKRAT